MDGDTVALARPRQDRVRGSALTLVGILSAIEAEGCQGRVEDSARTITGSTSRWKTSIDSNDAASSSLSFSSGFILLPPSEDAQNAAIIAATAAGIAAVGWPTSVPYPR